MPTPKNRPKISILCAHYNNHEYLPDFLNSLLWQTYDNWEAVIVDDCSTMGDPTDIVAAAEDTRIIYHRLTKNSGACAARNAAFARSSGEFVLCMDPDDILHPEFFSVLAAYSAQNEKQIVMFDYICFGKQTGLCRSTVKGLRAFLQEQWIPGVSMISRQQYAAVGGWDTADVLRYGNQDWEFWLNVLEHYPDIKIIHIPLPLMLYRQHARAITSSRNLHEYLTREYILHKHKTIFSAYGKDYIDNFLAEGYACSISYCFWNCDIGDAWRQLRCALFHFPKRLLYLKLRKFFGEARRKWFLDSYLRLRLRSIAIKILALTYNSECIRKIFWNYKARYIEQGLYLGDQKSLQRVLQKIRPKKVLDVGCGNGRFFPLYRSEDVSEIVGHDISSVALVYARKNEIADILLSSSEVTSLNYNDSYFDLTVCNRVLQYIIPQHIESVIKHICKISRYVYINEYNVDCQNTSSSFYSFFHDYNLYFTKFDFKIVDCLNRFSFLYKRCT